MELSQLPAVNSALNGLAFIFLFLGIMAIRSGNRERHKKMMLAALGSSALFMVSYLTYHFTQPVTIFQTEGWPRVVYLLILGPHIILATVMLPMIWVTFRRAMREDFEKHKRIARWTLPVWMYVSVTGVLVYLMLYQWFPNPQ